MAKNILVVSCDVAETRVALIENGIIAELHIERGGSQPRGGTVGDIYLGKVTRVLPGLQAAFVDIGLERAAFLHVEDLIRPDDLEAYLAGGRKQAQGGGENGRENSNHDTAHAGDDRAEADDGGRDEAPVPVHGDDVDVAADDPAEASEGDDARATEEPNGHTAEAAEEIAAAGGENLAAGESEGDEDDRSSGDFDGAPGALDEARASDPPDEPGLAEPPDESAFADGTDGTDDSEDELPALAGDAGDEADRLTFPDVARAAELDPADAPTARGLENPDSDIPPPNPEAYDDLLDDPNLPGFTVSDPGAPMPRAPAPRLEGPRESRGGPRGRRRRGRDRGRSGNGGSGGGGGGGGGNRPAREQPHRDRARGGSSAGRLSKSTPIRDVVKEGQEILIQITKEPIGTKGARCSSHVSLPGRYVVYLPTLEHVGVSKRIGSDKERSRLREAIEAMKPPAGGLIVRTVAEGLTKKQLKQDVGYLVHLWGEVAKKHEGARAPALLLGELDIVLKAARDLFTDEVDQLVIDDRAQYDRLSRFVEMFMPERLKDIAYYGDDEPIFDAYGIEDEISRALSRKVPLPSGGYLILDEAEALTAIDVNTGRFVGKGSKDMEETILKTNLEAVQEIAYQLRFRNIGGLIILDLIDMEKASNREKVRKTLEDLLQRDKAKTTLNRISDLGLIEMTRKRTRESLGRLLHEPCFYCDGTGHLQSKETVAYEILREIRRRRQDLPGYTILVNCHPAVGDLLTGSEKGALQETESRYMRRIQVNSRTEYHLEQFDLSGK
jgi:ribonuclease G